MYWCSKRGVEWFLCGPKMANCKSGGAKRMQWHAICIDWRIGHVSHHLKSFLGAIESTVLCAVVCIAWDFDAQIKETLSYNRGFDSLSILGRCNQLLTWNKSMKQIAFLIISSPPSLQILRKIQATFSGQNNFFSLFSISLPYADVLWLLFSNKHLDNFDWCVVKW